MRLFHIIVAFIVVIMACDVTVQLITGSLTAAQVILPALMGALCMGVMPMGEYIINKRYQ